MSSKFLDKTGLDTFWAKIKSTFQTLGNLVTTSTGWGSTPSDTKYPSEKLVKTALDSKVSKISNTELNNDVTTTWVKYSNRKIKISGNEITLDMSAASGGWAGGFAYLKDASATHTMLGFYGSSGALIHFFMGGTYNDPYFKMTPAGVATFKNSVKLPSISSADGSRTYTLNSSTGGELALKSQVDNKVDKETGKGLSTNDYTTTEKNKLAGIAAGAEVNVQSDWNQATTTADDYIKNKPTLGTAAAKDVPTSGNASTTQVVMGNDSRLTDSRTPTAHTHTADAADVVDQPGDSVITDSTDIITTHVNGYSSTNKKLYKRNFKDYVWPWIKDKISSVLGLSTTGYTGNAATATKATQDSDGNAINATYFKSSGNTTLVAGAAIKIGTQNGADVKLTLPTIPSGTQLVYDCGTGSTSTTDFNNAVAAFNAGMWVIIHSSSGVYYCVGTYSGGLRFKKLSNESSLLKVDTITWNSGSAPTAGNQIEASLSGHTHGNVTSDGKLQTDAEAIGSGDSLVVTDYSNSAKIARTSVTFDGTTTTKALTPKGTWETFVQDVSGKMNTNAGNAASGALQNLTGQLTEGTSDFTDNTEIFTSYAGNSGFAESGHVNQPYRRKASSMLNYIESKRFYERNPADNSVGTDTKRIQLGYGAYGSGFVGYCCYIVHIFFNIVGGSLQGKGVTLLVNYDWRETQYQNAKCQILSDNGLIDAGYQIVLANFKSDNNSKVHVCLGLVSTSAPTTLVKFAYSYCKIFRLCSGLNWTHSIASDNVGSYNDLIPSEYVKAISIGNANVGNANQPVYFSNGVPVACNWWVS